MHRHGRIRPNVNSAQESLREEAGLTYRHGSNNSETPMPVLVPDKNDLPALETGPLFECHPLAHIIYDLEHLRLLAVNAAAVARYGYGRDELLNLTRLDLLIGSERAATNLFISSLPTDAAKVMQRPCRERTRDGRVLHSDTRGLTGLYKGRPARMIAALDVVHRNEIESSQGFELLAATGRLAQVGAWSVELKTKHVFWSDVVCEIHEVAQGYRCSLDEAVAFYPGEASQTMRKAVKRCLDEGRSFDLELPFVGARGRERWVRATGEAVCDAAGRVVVLRGALQDITQRKRVEIELQESRARLAATLRAIPDLWFILDREGRYLEVSSRDHPSMTLEWERVVGRKFMDVENVPQAMIELVTKAMERLFLSEQQQTISYERDTLRNGRRAFEARLVSMLDGRILYLIRDVTELHDARRKFEAVLRAIPDLWFVVDADNRFVEVSASDDPRLIRPWSEIEGRRFGEVALDSELGRLGLAAIEACRLTGEIQTTKYSAMVANGETLDFEARFVPMEASRVFLLVRKLPPSGPAGSDINLTQH